MAGEQLKHGGSTQRRDAGPTERHRSSGTAAEPAGPRASAWIGQVKSAERQPLSQETQRRTPPKSNE
jgi:hypothetical protein